MEVFRIEPTDPLATLAAPWVRAALEVGHHSVAVIGKRDPAGWYPDAVHCVLVPPVECAKEDLEGYVDAAEWLRRHEEEQ